MSDKTDRDPFDVRYDDDDEAESAESAETSKTSKSTEMSESSATSESTETTESSKSSVRERKNVNMYLPDDLVDDLQLRYSELNVAWRREHGDDLPKNAEFYPAVIRAALNETSIEAELGLDD